MCLLSFNLLILILLIHTCSSSDIIEQKCLIDDNCAHQLACHKQTNTCICPKPYFWRKDIQACFGCAPGWLDLDANKCLLYAVSGSSGVTWYQAENICKDLMAQVMFINSTDEFQSLQNKIEDILNSETALAATVYFYQGAWININHERIDSYIWCNNDQKYDDHNCVQIRQNSSTNTICLQYVSCSETGQFICEAKPQPRLKLEKNIAESKSSIVNNDTEERSIRRKRNLRRIRQVLTQGTNNNLINQQTITKQPSTWTADHVTNLVTTGMQTAGQIANAFGNIFGKNTGQNANQQAAQPSIIYNMPQMPAALATNNNNESGWKGLFTTQNILIISGIGVGLLILITTMCCFCSKKKSKLRSKSSAKSIESSNTYE